MPRAQIVGATGYGGLGILELLLAHPNFEVTSLVARDDAGHRIDEVYPHLTKRTELVAQRISGAPIVGNPGCFAIGLILGLAPLFADGLVEDGAVSIASLSGSSGAGKKPAPLQHLSHLNDNVVPYRVLSHQHVIEA